MTDTPPEAPPIEPTTVPATWESLGLTPTYVRQSLLDLAEDQVRTEGQVARLNKLTPIAVGLSVGGAGLSLFSFKMVSNLIKGMTQLALALQAVQEHLGMAPPAPTPMPPVPDKRKEPTGPSATRVEPVPEYPQPVDEFVDYDAMDNNGKVVDLSTGEGLDDEPEELPEDVAEALMADNPPDFHGGDTVH